MHCMVPSRKFDFSLSFFMMKTCAPVSSNNFNDFLLTMKLIVYLSPTSSVTALVSFTVILVGYTPTLLIMLLCCSCS